CITSVHLAPDRKVLLLRRSRGYKSDSGDEDPNRNRQCFSQGQSRRARSIDRRPEEAARPAGWAWLCRKTDPEPTSAAPITCEPINLSTRHSLANSVASSIAANVYLRETFRRLRFQIRFSASRGLELASSCTRDADGVCSTH